MCGLVGVISSHKTGLVSWEIDLFFELWWVTALRGWEGSGFCTIYNHKDGKNKKAQYAKGIYTPFDVMYNPKNWNGMVKDRKIQAILGHCRSATSGKVNDVNSHPFEKNGKIFFHNGTIKNIKDFPEFNKFDVDSEGLLAAFDKLGIEKTLQQTDGDLACLWYDSADETINVIRNNNRPLFGVKVNDLLFISSEKIMLEFILNRKNKTGFTIEEYKAGTHFSYKYKDILPKETDFTEAMNQGKRTGWENLGWGKRWGMTGDNTDTETYGVSTKSVSSASRCAIVAYDKNKNGNNEEKERWISIKKYGPIEKDTKIQFYLEDVNWNSDNSKLIVEGRYLQQGKAIDPVLVDSDTISIRCVIMKNDNNKELIENTLKAKEAFVIAEGNVQVLLVNAVNVECKRIFVTDFSILNVEEYKNAS